MALLRYAAKYDPFLSLDCAPTPSTLTQSKERKGSNFAIWQPCCKAHPDKTLEYYVTDSEASVILTTADYADRASFDVGYTQFFL